MIYGQNLVNFADTNKSLFYAYDKKLKDASERGAVTDIYTERSANLETQEDGLISKQTEGEKVGGKQSNSAADVVFEYNIVKQMLINNSLPISDGKVNLDKDSSFSRKLIIDKKILLNLLIDL